MSITRKRLTPDESRASALEAARALLIENGPQAVTLKAVAARMGRTHANLLHHFGSAAELQGALAGNIAEQVCETIAGVVLKARQGEADPRTIVEMTFDAFDQQGAGGLCTWMIMSGNQDWVKDAPLLVLACADTLFNHNGQPNRFAQYDTGAAVENLCLQAEAMGLMAHQMGGYDADKARAAFGVPAQYTLMAMISVGYPTDPASFSAEAKERETAPRKRRELGELGLDWPGAQPERGFVGADDEQRAD